MEMIQVTNRKEYITPNFSVDEFWKAANPDQDFEFPKAFFLAAQILRDYVGEAVIVTSTYRANGRTGFHGKKRAIDFVDKFGGIDLIAEFKQECLHYINDISGNGSKLIENLRQVGINGFGVENVCIHLDIRPNKNCNRKDRYGYYMIFEYKRHWDEEKQIWVEDINHAL